MTPDELCAKGLEEVKRTLQTPNQIALDLMNQHWNDLSDPDRQNLAVEGLRYRIVNSVAAERATQINPRGHPLGVGWERPMPLTPYQKKLRKERQKMAKRREAERGVLIEGHLRSASRALSEIQNRAYKSGIEDLQSILLLSSNGQMKPLSLFNVKDCQKWKEESKNRFSSWKRRFAWFGKAKDLLQQHNAKRIDKLPAPDIRDLATLAKEVWKKEEIREPAQA